LKLHGTLSAITPSLKRVIVDFLKQESISAARSKEEKIAALASLGGPIDDPDAVAFLKQESLSDKRSVEVKIAALQALGREPGAGQLVMPQAQISRP
jgi:hypothetical protein